MHGDCDRAREWASADVDGVLSTFERVLLANHVAGCPPCREFRASIVGLTKAIRTTPHEQFAGIIVGRIRRRTRLRLAPAVAAMAVAVVGLGSILASSQVRTRAVARVPSASTAIDTMNVSTNTARALAQRRVTRVLPSAVHRSLRGGPVLHER